MKSDYNAARAEAQRLADEDGFDRGLERNPFYGWTHFLLPGKSYRAGHELRCEVVSCSDLKRCRPGHGPMAVDRNPAPTYHGGPRR